MDAQDIYEAQLYWAHQYRGYDRFATVDAYSPLITPAELEYERTGRIPAWCGVDYLRAWAFMLARRERHSGTWAFALSLGFLAKWNALMQAIYDHPAASADDRPPLSAQEVAEFDARCEADELRLAPAA